MNSVLENLKTKASETRTENGDIAYNTTYNQNLDFFFSSSLYVGSPEKAVVAFARAYTENKELAIKNLAYLRDIKSGLGFRAPFRAILTWLGENDPAVLDRLLLAFVELGRWDDILPLIFVKGDDALTAALKEIVSSQYHDDLRKAKSGKGSVSLLAKWLPKINSANYEQRKLAYAWARILFSGSYRNQKYRRNTKIIRDYIGVLETKLVNKDYTFDYQHVPGRAMTKYRGAFMRNDGDRFINYIESLKQPQSETAEKLKERVKQLYPYEILRQVDDNAGELRKMGEEMWKALPQADAIEGKVLTVYDGSGSMMSSITGKGNASISDVARSLAIYTSERLTGEFKDKVIAFAANPRYIDLSKTDGSLHSRSMALRNFTDATNTNLAKVFNLVLASSKNATPEDYIDTLLIITDCEFDAVYSHQGLVVNSSTFQNAKKQFAEAGVPLPKVVYWNLNSRRVVVPVSHDELDEERVILVSGFSTYILDSISKNHFDSADKVMNDALAKYDYLLDLLK